jgi:hypothetical protein
MSSALMAQTLEGSASAFYANKRCLLISCNRATFEHAGIRPSATCMRAIFDQYVHPENRLTHALVACLAEDPTLLAAFLRWLGIAPPRGERLLVVEQRLPGEAEDREEVAEADSRRLPDAWIYTASGWALLIESKIASSIDAAQLRGHLAIAERRGFSDVRLLVLSPNEPTRALPGRCLHRRWRDLYRWGCGEASRSPWATHLVRYMPVAEERMVNDEYLKEGTLTTFTGIPFGSEVPYTYLEAKRLLRLLMAEVRANPLLDAVGANRQHPGRKSITGSAQPSVWDYLPLRIADGGDAFNAYPHLTLSIRRDRALAHLILPNSMETDLRRRLAAGGYEAFKQAIGRFLDAARPLLAKDAGAKPVIGVWQRHYLHRTIAVYDAILEFDPRTAFPAESAVKRQEEWLRTTFEILVGRRSNVQIGIGVAYAYDRSTKVASSDFAGSVATAWAATRPLLELMGAVPQRQSASAGARAIDKPATHAQTHTMRRPRIKPGVAR